jgi:hypothetical protein
MHKLGTRTTSFNTAACHCQNMSATHQPTKSAPTPNVGDGNGARRERLALSSHIFNAGCHRLGSQLLALSRGSPPAIVAINQQSERPGWAPASRVSWSISVLTGKELPS